MASSTKGMLLDMDTWVSSYGLLDVMPCFSTSYMFCLERGKNDVVYL